jgi:hypothetical protein
MKRNVVISSSWIELNVSRIFLIKLTVEKLDRQLTLIPPSRGNNGV